MRSLAVDGATASVEPLVAAVTALAVAGIAARRAVGLGVVAVVLGATFSGALRALAPLAAARERGGMLSAMYAVSYLAFGVPAIVAGRLVASLGLMPFVVGFGGVILAGAALALVMQVRLAQR